LRPLQLYIKGKIMATEKQTLANQENSKLSTGPTSPEGILASSQNNFRHGLAPRHHEVFTFMKDEEPARFGELLTKLLKEHSPQGETQKILVRRMAESEWLRARAVRLQTDCFTDYDNLNEKRLSLFIRYETTHERAFYRALKELQTLRKEKHNTEIGFESQKLKQAAETRASEAQNLRREQFEFKKIVDERKNEVRPAAKSDPDGKEMAA
jgi:hypothetical protein